MEQNSRYIPFIKKLKKACKRKENNQKLIVTGDFNATTSVSLKQCYYDVEDSLCNDNGTRIKTFCREQNLCMSQSFFDHPLDKRYTWTSPDGQTKKVIDYILVEKYVQYFMKDCLVDVTMAFVQTTICMQS